MTAAQQQLVILYQAMADLTSPECAACRVPRSCCSPEYCEMAAVVAREHWGVELESTGHPTLLFMGPSGCVVPPHLRPLCTLHTCQINGLGCKPGDEAWTARYFEIREQIESLED